MKLIRFILVAAILALSMGLVHATDISGTISSTLVITKNSQLVGDVTCTVQNAPCIQFGAPTIKLNLNGHTLTGLGSRDTCPSGVVDGENGIDTNLKNTVSIEGPGTVRRFRASGVLVTGNTSGVEHITVISSCQNGIRVLGHANHIENDTVVLSSLSGGQWAGIFCGGTGGHSIQRNEAIGAAPGVGVVPISGPLDVTNVGGNGIVVGSNGNTIATNNASGNAGVGFGMFALEFGAETRYSAGLGGAIAATGNSVHDNSAFGNTNNYDFVDNNLPGSNTYYNNACETSSGPGAPSCAKVSAVAGHAIPVN